MTAGGRARELDGARAVAALWWLAFAVLFFASVASPRAAAAARTSAWGRAAWGGDRAIDAWLVVSGFVANLALAGGHPVAGLRWPAFVARSVARRWPTYLLVLAITVTLPRVPGVSTGAAAVWNVVALNDLVPVLRQTMAWTWPIALLVKLHVVTPPLVAWLDTTTHRRGLAALGALIGLSAAATAVTAAVTGMSLPDADLSPDGNFARWSRGFDALHTPPHLRAGAFFVGVAASRVDATALPARMVERPIATACAAVVAAFAIVGGLWLGGARGLPAAVHPLALGAAGPLVALGVGAWLLILRSPHPLGRLAARQLEARALSRVARLSFPGLLIAPLVALGATVALGGRDAPLMAFALVILAPTWLLSEALAATTGRAGAALAERFGGRPRPW